jgi:23S rRNA (guanosine2251-2'-O)-methyltransferase
LENQTDYIYGLHSVLEAIKSEKNISKIFLDKDRNYPNSFLSIVREKKISLSYVPKVKIRSFSKEVNQGIVAIVSPVKFYKIEDISFNGDSSDILILNSISDVRNLGAIIRSAECFGIKFIILDKKCAVINQDSMKASSGAINYVKIIRVENLKTSLIFLKEKKIKIIGCSEKSKNSIFKTKLNHTVAFLMGSEGFGIEKNYLDMCDELVCIPMIGKVSSLNVSVASAIFLYESFKQKS